MKLSENSAVSIGLVIVLGGIIWSAAMTHSLASNAFAKATRTEDTIERRIELNNEKWNQLFDRLGKLEGKMDTLVERKK